MEICFKTNRLQKICEDPKKARKELGADIGNKLTLRINELRAANTLAVVSKIPAARLHRLAGTRSKEFAVDLEHPFRLVFIAENGIMEDIGTISIVRVEEIVDYHGKQKRK